MLDWNKTAFVFPGQGSQAVGMGKDIAAEYPVASATFEHANDLLGIDLSRMMFSGDDATLGDTAITQPAMYVCSMAMYRVIQQQFPQAVPAFVAGHSLGEFTALTVAEVLSFEDGLTLVQQRGQLMKAAGDTHPGGMAAILALDVDTVAELVARVTQESGTVVVIANDNCPGQVVISGEQAGLEQAIKLAKDAGARRAIALDVSVATHSPLMQPAQEQFVSAMNDVTFHPARIPVYQNVCACPVTDPQTIRENLKKQLVSSVQWTGTIEHMVENAIDTFVEIGSKNVLTGLLRRINRDKIGIAVQDLTSLDTFLKTLA